jgi:hypothetical protein
MLYGRRGVACAWGVFLALCLSVGALGDDDAHDHRLVVIEELPEEALIWPDGTVVRGPGQRVWKPICGSDTSNVTQEAFEQMIADTKAFIAREPMTVIDNTVQRQDMVLGGAGGINLIFNVSGGLSPEATQAVAEVEAYIERQFASPVSVTVSFSMQSMGSGVLGAAGSNYVSPPSWPTMRDALQSSMDADDDIQNWLPTGSTIPVRYNIASDFITDENRVYATRGNYSALAGQQGGTAVSITLNTDFSWDFDPSNGVPGSFWCFQSVLVHEVGHALGFTSGTDFRSFDMETLDVYRFQRTAWNPSTLAEFQTLPRTVHKNSLNDANSDIIVAEYRMEDGNPRQASHFRDNLSIGIMDPTLGGGQTFWPNFYRKADLDMLDAIGWSFSDCNGNLVNDFFEILDGDLEDLNLNDIPDDCEREAPLYEIFSTSCLPCSGEGLCINGQCYAPKNRYLSIRPQNAGSSTALRVKHVDSGMSWWVGEPDVEGIARLASAPEFRDWGLYPEVIQVGDCPIVPGASYEVQSLLDIDDPQDEGAYSAVLAVPTVSLWGDVTGSSVNVPSDGSVNFSDVSAVVDCFRASPNALPLERCDLSATTPDATVNFQDVSAAVDAFRGLPYPFADPTTCP